MRHHRITLPSCVLLVWSFGARAGSATAVDSMTKVRRDDAPPPSNAQVSLEAAQNEFEAFQIVISGPATGIHIKTTALTGPGGTISPADCSVPGNIHVYREAFLQIASSTGNGSPQMPPPLSDNNGKGGWVPDALIPQVDEFDAQCRSQFYADVPVGQNQVLWFEVFVPGQGVPAGHYTGQVLLAWTGATACESATINVNLKVWNFPLPVTASLRSYFGSSTFAALPRQHAVAAPSASMSALVQRYAATGLDHRISMTNFDDGNTSDLNNYNNNYSPLLDGTQQLTRLQRAATTRVSFIAGPKNQTSSYNAFFNSFSGKPWLSNVFTYTVDEPPVNGRYCDIGPLGTAAHQSSYQVIPALITKDYDNLVAFQSAPPDCGTGTVSPYSIQPPAGGVADVNIMAPVIDVLDGNSSAGPANTRQKYNDFLTYASGSSQRLINDVWTYESCDTHGCASYASNPLPAGGLQSNLWPSIGAVDHSLVRSRAMPWLAYYNDVKGVLYYDTLAAYSTGSQDPWHNLYYAGGNGDGTLFYPGTPAAIGGTTHVPVASLRLKMLREGMEDYEYMWHVAAPGRRRQELGEGVDHVRIPAWMVDGPVFNQCADCASQRSPPDRLQGAPREGDRRPRLWNVRRGFFDPEPLRFDVHQPAMRSPQLRTVQHPLCFRRLHKWSLCAVCLLRLRLRV